MRFFDSVAVSAALSPVGAVRAITYALRDGFDPATDVARTTAHTTAGHFLLMPSEVGDVAGVKVATVAPANPDRGLPRIQGTYLLYDAETLSHRATLDGATLTSLRTPAVSIAAIAPALTRFEGPLHVVVFGAGPQASAHLDTLAAVTGQAFMSVTVVTRSPERVPREVSNSYEVLATTDPAVAARLADAQVIICATTAREPLFPSSWVADDAVVIAVGSHEPDARELDGELLSRSNLIVEDVETALREAGDVVIARDEGHITAEDLIPMRAYVRGEATISEDRPVVFKSVGMSWQDLVIAAAIEGAHQH